MNDMIREVLRSTGENFWEVINWVENHDYDNEEYKQAISYFCSDDEKETPLCIHEFIDAWFDILSAFEEIPGLELRAENQEALETMQSEMEDGDFESFYNLLRALEYPMDEDREDQFKLIRWFNNATNYNMNSVAATWGIWQILACCEGVRETFGYAPEN